MEQQKFERVRHEYLKLSELDIHPEVQRTLKQSKVDQYATSFDPDLFGEASVIVTPRSLKGQYKPFLVFDGQHRILAAIKYLGDQQRVPCAVYDDTNTEHLAKMFLGVNDRQSLQPYDKWKIRILANEPTAIHIDKILHKRQLMVANQTSAGKVRAVSALNNVYSRYGAETLEQALDVLLSAWGRDPEAFDGSILRATSFLCHHFNGQLDHAELAKKISKATPPHRLIGDGRDIARISGVSVERALAEKILQIYNKHKKVGLELK